MSGPQITITRRLPASANEVFDEWLDPDGLREWMCPRPAHLRSVEVDPVEGGAYRFEIVDGTNELTVTGIFLLLDRPSQLQFTWSCDTWEDPTIQSIVTVTLEHLGDAECEMTLTHERLPMRQVPNHRNGWNAVFTQLDAKLRRPR